jgi:DNA replication and repair protein RecF
MTPPLRIDRLVVRSFRNLAEVELCPGPGFNVFHGDNGAGKSNLLEAIDYLGTLKSFRGAKTAELVMLGTETARVEAKVSGEAAPRTYRVTIGHKLPRRAELDGKRPRSIAAWHASIHVVLFHPGDLALAAGPPEPRRSFLDGILEQMDPTFSSAQKSYTRALKGRNRLLRHEDVDRRSIQAFDEILASAGAVVGQSRALLAEELGPLTEQAVGEVHGAALRLAVEYRPRVTPTTEALRAALANALDKDIARGFTADGPHADDLSLTVLEGVSARHHASQGQHRAIALGLKIAELRALSSHVGRVPILLLDDVSSELDRTRNRRLFELLGTMGGQVFMTTTHPEFIRLEKNRVDYEIVSGTVNGFPRSRE